MISVEIANWKDLVGQFGLLDTKSGPLSAKQISRSITLEVAKAASIPNHISVSCNTDSEAIALFDLVSKTDKSVHYEYTGTAN